MKISYVTIQDAKNVHNWSGLNYYIANSLKNQQAELSYIDNLHMNEGLKLTLKKYLYYAFGKSFSFEREPLIANQYATQVKKRIKTDSDLIFSPGSIPIALLETQLPKVFYTDATFAGMLGFYEGFSRLSAETIKHGNYLEQEALNSCKMAIYASDWAAKTAIENYQVDPEKVKVVPFGANIECNRTLKDIKELISCRSRKKCKLLFLGVEWERKGGNQALEVARKLNESGIETELHVAGLNEIPVKPLPPYVINHGYISKASIEGKNKLDLLFAESHFLILPSKAEAFGVVFAEASSFGLPSLSTNVGGITSAVKDEINGKTFSLSSNAEDYANYIHGYFNNKEKYEQLAYSSFNEYEHRLNWKVSGQTIMNLLKGIG